MFHQRKHIRLREFDYSSPNAYFITVCVQHFVPLLGSVKNGSCGLNEIGNEIALNLHDISEHYPYSLMDEFIVMPNHFHCIIIITKINHIYIYRKQLFKNVCRFRSNYHWSYKRRSRKMVKRKQYKLSMAVSFL